MLRDLLRLWRERALWWYSSGHEEESTTTGPIYEEIVVLGLCAKAELSSTQLWAEISTFTFTFYPYPSTFQMLFRLPPKTLCGCTRFFCANRCAVVLYLHLPRCLASLHADLRPATLLPFSCLLFVSTPASSLNI